jgi:AraC-like DNA-binding protein
MMTLGAICDRRRYGGAGDFRLAFKRREAYHQLEQSRTGIRRNLWETEIEAGRAEGMRSRGSVIWLVMWENVGGMWNMKQGSRNHLSIDHLSHPLLDRLSEMARRLIGIGFLVVFPTGSGWGQALTGGRSGIPAFCRLIQGTMEGVKHCQMCHVLMAVAGSREQLTEQRCHAGASVLVAPIPLDGGDSIAVLGTCTFARGEGPKAWKEIRDRGKEIGVNLSQLRKYYNDLPELSLDDIEMAHTMMGVFGEAVKEIMARSVAERALADLKSDLETRTEIQSAVERGLKETMSDAGALKPGRMHTKKRKIPVLIRVVTDLISRNSSMPFSVSEIAAAARMTPNHFSSLFRLYTGQSFVDFLTEKRIALAKELLADLTLNIAEVAIRAGFEDPSYFTRRFRQRTGMTPTDWRNTLPSK